MNSVPVVRLGAGEIRSLILAGEDERRNASIIDPVNEPVYIADSTGESFELKYSTFYLFVVRLSNLIKEYNIPKDLIIALLAAYVSGVNLMGGSETNQLIRSFFQGAIQYLSNLAVGAGSELTVDNINLLVDLLLSYGLTSEFIVGFLNKYINDNLGKINANVVQRLESIKARLSPTVGEKVGAAKLKASVDKNAQLAKTLNTEYLKPILEKTAKIFTYLFLSGMPYDEASTSSSTSTIAESVAASRIVSVDDLEDVAVGKSVPDVVPADVDINDPSSQISGLSQDYSQDSLVGSKRERDEPGEDTPPIKVARVDNIAENIANVFEAMDEVLSSSNSGSVDAGGAGGGVKKTGGKRFVKRGASKKRHTMKKKTNRRNLRKSKSKK